MHGGIIRSVAAVRVGDARAALPAHDRGDAAGVAKLVGAAARLLPVDRAAIGVRGASTARIVAAAHTGVTLGALDERIGGGVAAVANVVANRAAVAVSRRNALGALLIVAAHVVAGARATLPVRGARVA